MSGTWHLASRLTMKGREEGDLQVWPELTVCSAAEMKGTKSIIL